MSVTDTSKAAYTDLKESGTLSKQQFLILDKMRYGGVYTRKELQRAAGLEINAISGRVNELVKAGYIGVVAGKVLCSITKRLVEGIVITKRGHEQVVGKPAQAKETPSLLQALPETHHHQGFYQSNIG